MSESSTKTSPHYRWNDVPKEELNPLITRQMIHGATMTMARIELRKGAIVPEHSHANEQISTIESGRALFVLDGVEHVMTAGVSLVIAPHVKHWVEALDDSIAVDLFSPPREDWIRGEDAYLRK